MTTWIMIAALTLSSSLDNLGVGLSYGIRGIRIQIRANAFIALICFLFSICGIYFGMWVSDILPGILPIILSAIILVLFGIRMILLSVPRGASPADEPAEVLISGKLQRVMNDPTAADFDRSKSIGLGEAAFLGIALSANALTNGVGAGLLGLSPVLISLLAAAGSFITVWIGVSFGMKLAHIRLGKWTIGQSGTVISGAFLVLIAVSLFLEG
ncbi:sporulation membrane protein YtaF [Paenibacillus pinisoli]|uniref:Sporulation membrane protein YtaF n=1 Tax=Paenibacillus pinisoli TaxID=1276110 RepID=A0A3A6PI58_9BACL|nr:sporulation membrane protein YtaF [Paenibacillus pinisoli]RJX38728.1 sporulation membrane protein YtaF [Paenibacillus pinisoli]